MLSVRVDGDMNIEWCSDKSAEAGVRCGQQAGTGSLVPPRDAIEFVRRCTRAMLTGQEQRYTSSLGAVLIVPDADGAVAYLQPFDLDGEAEQLPTKVGDLTA